MPLPPFATGTKKGKSLAVDTESLINCYPEIAETPRSKSLLAIYGRPGLELFGAWGEMPCRGLHEFGVQLLAVFNNRLEIIRNDAVSYTAGTLETFSSRVSIADNGTLALLVDGRAGYLFPYTALTATVTAPLLTLPLHLAAPSYGASTTVDAPLLTLALTLAAPAAVTLTTRQTLAKIVDPDFPDNPQHVAYLDGYFIVTAENSARWYISPDGINWQGLDFATAEADPDPVRTVVTDHGEVWLFGDVSTEVWQNTGNADFPFERLEGAKIQWGIQAPWSAARYADTLVCLANDGEGTIQVVSFVNYQPRRISNTAVEAAIATYATITDAIGYVYADRGHTFYVLAFPAANAAWAFDIRSGEWHQLYSGIANRFVPERAVYFLGKRIVDDHTTGKLYRIDASLYDDAGAPILMRLTGAHLSDNQRKLGHASLQIVFEAGVGTATGQGADPQAMLRWSNDGGSTWSSERWASIGKIGERFRRAIWRALGRARDRVYQIDITDPVKRVIVGIVLVVK